MKRLPDAELCVMQALWGGDAPATRAEIEARLADTHPMAATTLLTLLGRLAEKEFVAIQKEGRTTLYTPAIRREVYLAEQSRHLFQKLYGGSLKAFASALCDSGLSKEELQELGALLERNAL